MYIVYCFDFKQYVYNIIVFFFWNVFNCSWYLNYIFVDDIYMIKYDFVEKVIYIKYLEIIVWIDDCSIDLRLEKRKL